MRDLVNVEESRVLFQLKFEVPSCGTSVHDVELLWPFFFFNYYAGFWPILQCYYT